MRPMLRMTSRTALAVAVLDLVKALEKVRLHHVWTWAKYYGCPLDILAMVLTYFAGERRVVFDGSASQPARTKTAILAGSKFSVKLLKLMFTKPLQDLRKLYPELGV